MPKPKRNDVAAKATKRRRRGYRGYGSPLGRSGEEYGGTVHWGRGFAGVGFPGESGALLPPGTGILSDDLREEGRPKPPGPKA